jgi:nitrogen PTS system EIIA component
LQLSMRDIAHLFSASERTVLGWIRKDGLPSTELGGQHRFNRSEVLEWALEKGMEIPSAFLTQGEGEGADNVSLSDSLRLGGVFGEIPGETRAEALRTVVDTIPLPQGIHSETLFQHLMAREDLGSTALGDGIAVPHARNPIVLHTRNPLLFLCYLAEKVDYGAVDGQKVDTLFLIISPHVKGHLNILSRLCFALKDERFRACLKRRAPLEDMMKEVCRIEEGLQR